MNKKEKAELIRKGNTAFNEGNIPLAAKIFKAVNYKDGLIRVGDYYFNEKHQPLMAYGYYNQANHNIMKEKIFDGFIFALKAYLHESEDDLTLPDREERQAGRDFTLEMLDGKE